MPSKCSSPFYLCSSRMPLAVVCLSVLRQSGIPVGGKYSSHDIGMNATFKAYHGTCLVDASISAVMGQRRQARRPSIIKSGAPPVDVARFLAVTIIANTGPANPPVCNLITHPGVEDPPTGGRQTERARQSRRPGGSFGRRKVSANSARPGSLASGAVCVSLR